jgi:formate C-acetyltransferase
VDRKTLLDAREHPDAHSDLLVRIGGYSDYFVRLTPTLQQEIIDRTEY